MAPYDTHYATRVTRSDKVWRDVVRCGAVWRGVARGVAQCGAVWRGVTRFDAV